MRILRYCDSTTIKNKQGNSKGISNYSFDERFSDKESKNIIRNFETNHHDFLEILKFTLRNGHFCNSIVVYTMKVELWYFFY
jgi:hypothetical protein